MMRGQAAIVVRHHDLEKPPQAPVRGRIFSGIVSHFMDFRLDQDAVPIFIKVLLRVYIFRGMPWVAVSNTATWVNSPAINPAR